MRNNEQTQVGKPAPATLSPLVPEREIDNKAFAAWLVPVLRNVNAANGGK